MISALVNHEVTPSLIQMCVNMEMCSWCPYLVQLAWQERWRSAWMEHGATFVEGAGHIMMLVLCASNWATHLKVHSL